ncbi:MAG: OmpA family protein [Chitinophagaceae bacterium]
MKKIINSSLIAIAVILVFSSCVAKRKYLDSQIALRSVQNDSALLANKVSTQEATIAQLQQQVADLNNKYGQLSTESSNKQSQLNANQQELASQQQRLEHLQQLMDQQRQVTENLRKKMADALVGFSSNELTVSQKNGKVYVSLSENLLFPSGSAVVNPKGKEALSKLADVLNVNPDISVDIEGHTDSIPIRGKYEDNWALSVARATSIVRILVTDYKVDPTRVIASGHSWFDPVQTNSTPEGRALNRRTEIILSPKLDELYKLLEPNSAGTQ